MMELWIRSQDKEMLSLVKTLFIEDINDDNKLFGITDGYVYYGEYNSKERALEVLDEIQEHIINQGKTAIITEDGINNKIVYYGNVYEMPKE